MMNFEMPMLLILAGLVLSFVGFTFFRQPGVPFFFLGPVWRASKYVTPTGALLWKAGSLVGLVGAIALLWSNFW